MITQVDTILLARYTVVRIRENIIIAIVIKVVVLIFAFTTGIALWMAVLADLGSLLLVLANGSRTQWFFEDDGPGKTGDDAPDHDLLAAQEHGHVFLSILKPHGARERVQDAAELSE